MDLWGFRFQDPLWLGRPCSARWSSSSRLAARTARPGPSSTRARRASGAGRPAARGAAAPAPGRGRSSPSWRAVAGPGPAPGGLPARDLDHAGASTSWSPSTCRAPWRPRTSSPATGWRWPSRWWPSSWSAGPRPHRPRGVRGPEPDQGPAHHRRGHAAAQLDDVHLDMLPDGTAIGSGLATALTRLRRSQARSKVVVLVTDGANNAGEIDPATATDLARAMEVRVYTVLVGRGGEVPMPVRLKDPVTGQVFEQRRMVEVHIDPELLKTIAERTGGEFFRAADPASLRQIFERIDRLEKSEIKQASFRRYAERYRPVPRWRRRSCSSRPASPGRAGSAWPRSSHDLRLAAMALRPARRCPSWRCSRPPHAPRPRPRPRASWRAPSGPRVLRRDPRALAVRPPRPPRWPASRGIVLALARPQWGIVREKIEREGADVVLLLDSSGSMATADVAPNRFFLARHALLNLVTRLEGDRFAPRGLRRGGLSARPPHPGRRRGGPVPRYDRARLVPSPGSSLGRGWPGASSSSWTRSAATR